MKYATDDAQAAKALAAILADAKGGLVAIDIETAPHESERQRLAALKHKEAAARGTLKALTKLRDDTAAIGKAKADLKALIAQRAYAERAGLDPDRAWIRLLQVYGGGRTVLVADMTRVGIKVFAPLWDIPLVAHNAAFELSFLHRPESNPRKCTARCKPSAAPRPERPGAGTCRGDGPRHHGHGQGLPNFRLEPATPDARADRICRRRRCRLLAPRKQGAAASGRKGTGLRRSR